MKNLKIISTLLITFGVIVLINCTKDACDYDLGPNISATCTVCADPTFTKVGNGTSCQKTTSTPATFNGTLFNVTAGDSSTAYGWGGANVYITDTSLYTYTTPPTGNIMQDGNGNTVNPSYNFTGIWLGGTPSTGRLNKVGIWGAGIPNNQWIGFTHCIDVVAKKKVYVGMAGDNRFRFSVNGHPPYAVETNNSNTFNFTHWHIFEIELQPGKNIISMQGYNDGGAASFGAEIYDATLSQIQLWTTDAEIDSATIFSTKDMRNQTTQIGNINGWSCPNGLAVDFCTGDSIPVCTLIQNGGVVACP